MIGRPKGSKDKSSNTHINRREAHLDKKSNNWKGGRTIKDGYILIWKPKHLYAKNGYVAEHRLVMEKHLGRFLKPTEVVHHIDEDKTNNSLSNLKYFKSNGAHRNYHKHKKSQRGKNNPNWKGGITKDLKKYHRDIYLRRRM